MAHFVKWQGAINDRLPPGISKSTQGTVVGGAFRFGVYGAAGLTIGPKIPGVAQINPRETVEGGSNNVTWYEVVGLKEGSATIEVKHPTGTIWDSFELRMPL